MNDFLVMTLIGRDRVGLVKILSAIIEEHGGNWEESRMVQLGGQFAGLLHVHVPHERAAELEQALGSVEDLAVVVERTADQAGEAAEHRFVTFEVIGQDHPGIVRQIAQTLAAREVNVEELETERVDAPMSGEPMFQAVARVSVPAAVSVADLQADLERIAADLMVDIRLEERS